MPPGVVELPREHCNCAQNSAGDPGIGSFTAHTLVRGSQTPDRPAPQLLPGQEGSPMMQIVQGSQAPPQYDCGVGRAHETHQPPGCMS